MATTINNPQGFDTVVVDGDWLLYNISSTCENEYIEVRDSIDSTDVRRFKNITEFRKTIPKAESSTARTDYIIEDKKELKAPNSFDIGVFSLKAKISKIKRETNAKKVILALAGTSNFRDRIPLPVEYKGQRSAKGKPMVYYDLRAYVEKYENVNIAIDQEADDLLSINQYENKDTGKSVSSTIDKDNKSIPGYLHNPVTGTVKYISGLGSFNIDESTTKKKLVGYGRCWEYIQWCMGDSVDYYHPQDLLSKKCIEAKQSQYTKVVKKMSVTDAYKDMSKLKTDKDWLKYIHDLYYSWYKDLTWYKTWDNKLITNIDYIDLLQCYVDCVHMRRWENDRVDIRKVFKDQGIIK